MTGNLRTLQVHDRRQGFALLMVLMLIVSASVIGGSYLYAASVQTASAQNLLLATRAQYLAESGMMHGLYELQNNPRTLGSESSPVGPYHADSTANWYKFYTNGTGRPWEYRITGIGGVGSLTQTSSAVVQVISDYEKKVQVLNPRHWWRLGDTGWVAVDEKGLRHGVYSNGTKWGEGGAILGDSDTGAEFDGYDDYINLGNMDLSGSQLTIACWAMLDDWDTTDGRLISKAYGIYTWEHYWMLSTYSGKGLRFRLRLGSGAVYELKSADSTITPREWFFAVATYDGTRMRIYLNGKIVASMYATGLINTNAYVNAWIGGNPSGAFARPWDGRIDDMFICNYALSDSQIKDLYNARVPRVETVSWGQ